MTGPNAIATARRLGSVVVDYFGRAMLPLAEAVSIGILEAIVRLLELQRALEVPPDAHPGSGRPWKPADHRPYWSAGHH